MVSGLLDHTRVLSLWSRILFENCPSCLPVLSDSVRGRWWGGSGGQQLLPGATPPFPGPLRVSARLRHRDGLRLDLC